MSSIWYPWCWSECECCTAQGCSSVGVSTCWRSVKCRFLVRSILRSLPCQGRSEVLLERRLWARKSALGWGEDRSSCWSPKSKSDSSTSLADSAMRNSSHPWSVLGSFAGEDSLVVARCCLISSSSSGVRVVVVGDVVDVAWGGWGGETSGSSWDSWDSGHSGCLINIHGLNEELLQYTCFEN